MKINIRVLYLYLFSFVGLLIAVIGTIQLVDLGLKTYVFREADKYDAYPIMVEQAKEARESTAEAELRMEKDLVRGRQKQMSNSIAMVAVGVPLYLYHWGVIKKEGKKKES